MSSTRSDRKSDHEGVQVHIRPTRKRATPFLGALLATFVVLPALYVISRAIMLWDRPSGVMIADGWLISCLVLALIAMGVGLFHAKRTSFLIKHVAVTFVAVGLGGNLFTLLGFKYRLLNITSVFVAAVVWGSWMLYRIDVFRAKATGESGDSWGELIGLAKSRPRKIRTTETQVIAEIEHGPGETIADVRRAAGELEDKAGAIVGRTTVTPNERGGGSTITFTMADPFDEWRKFPGPSHPGDTFAMPYRTAYYENGETQWFGFVTGRPSPHTDFVSPRATFVGLVGTTGAGKSGEQNNIAAETLTRRDVILCWVDAEKLYQNAGWCLDMLGMAAKNRDQAKRLSRALRKLAEFRVELFGQVTLDAIFEPGTSVGGREWTPELAEETGEAAVVVIMDEADTFLSRGEWDWLGKRGRSLGIFLVPAVPRASTQEVPAAFRGSIAAWKTFAIGDKYSGEFTLSDIAREGGANPEHLRISGAHYFDLVPGVPQRLWPMLCRSYWSDGGTLRRMVLAARAGRLADGEGRPLCLPFQPMTFSADAIRWMGDDYQACTPAAVMALRGPGLDDDDEEDGGDGVAVPQDEAKKPAPAKGPGDGKVDEDMDDIERSESGTDPDEDGGQGRVSTLTHPELANEAAQVDPRSPQPPLMADGEVMELPDTKPDAPNPDQEVADIHAALRGIAEEGLAEFTPEDLSTRLRYAMNPWTVSRRLGALSDGDDRLTPPGLRVERIRAGLYMMVRTRPQPTRRNDKEGD